MQFDCDSTEMCIRDSTGGFSEEQLKQNEENAYKLGAVKYVTLDVTQEYYEKSLKYMVFIAIFHSVPRMGVK